MTRDRIMPVDDDAHLRDRVAEIDQRLRQTYQAEKLAAVARLAAGLAHEMNNPIGFMRSNLATLGQYLERVAVLRGRLADAPAAWQELDLDFVTDDGRELVRDCIGGADRIARLVSDLQGFSNVNRPDEQMADINDCLRAAVRLIEPGKLPGIRLDLDLQPLPQLLCLPGHLNQVFFNIMENALQASGDDGQVTVASGVEAEAVVVRIRDCGSGIAPDDLALVFEPFFTTQPVGDGSGLGLTVARDIVQAHDGDIGIDSLPGRGTTVTIRLPL